jgi:predicted lipoprotein with Yx(FWY)xxD motif
MKCRIIAAVSLILLCLAWTTSAQETGNTFELGVTNDGVPTLVDAQGLTLYTFEHDEEGVSSCYEACAEEWPPYTIEEGVEPTVGAGIPGAVGTVPRDDGTTQVTYQGEPVYYYFGDAAPGDANGHGLEDVWFEVNPATVMMGGNDELGNFLVGPGGMTLYIFFEDHVGESYCYDECSREWPALIVHGDAQPLAAEGVSGALGLIEREDGSMQVTYNDIPLYFFHEDEAPGDALGNGSKEVWFTALSEGQELPPEEES